ncbi:MAG: hypothetical protein R2864_10640 [Syntrophotaleaceae bacterium]
MPQRKAMQNRTAKVLSKELFDAFMGDSFRNHHLEKTQQERNFNIITASCKGNFQKEARKASAIGCGAKFTARLLGKSST